MSSRSTTGCWPPTAEPARGYATMKATSSNLLWLALSQHHAYAGRPDVIEMAMLYTAGIVRDRPFIDGNKRTGFCRGHSFP